MIRFSPAQVIELGNERRSEAHPGKVFFLGKITNFSRYWLGDRERDVAVVARRSILWDAIQQEAGDLAGVVPVAHPIKRPPFFRRQRQGIYG